MNEPWFSEEAMAQAVLIIRSHRHWLARELLSANGASDRNVPTLAQALFNAPRVVVSHGTEADPVLNYGNRSALALWEMSWEDLTRTPSRLTAEAVAREERARLLGEVTRNGFISNYAGVRISSTGRRFRIFEATVWNLIDTEGRPAGQAASFDRWEFL
ncbi:MAG: hypothetical protein RIS76_1232 [Verrucomicrobiota bacterium]|jgi:hypothetical protein